MEKTTFGLIAALGAAAMAPAAYAAATPADRIQNPTSVAELLEPVANPVATLNALNSQRQLEAVDVADMQVADETVIVRHRHHHHHHRFIIMRRHRHHHHHHHHNM